MENKKVAIVIVNHNGYKYLKKCLDAIYCQEYSSLQVYFVDNGSTDKSVEFVKAQYPLVKIIELDKNYGFARGTNEGVKKGLIDGADYLVFLNNDTEVKKGWLKYLVESANLSNSIGMVSSKSLFPNGNIQTVGLAIEKNLKGGQEGGLSIGYNKPENIYNKRIEIFAPSGVSALYKRELIEKIGLLDEKFFCYGEDVDLGFRARLAGWKCLYDPRSKLIHYHSQTGKAASPFKAYHIKRNSFFVAVKNFCFTDVILYPLRDINWNIRQIFTSKRTDSVDKLKSDIGMFKIIIITFKAYLSIFRHLPKMIISRYKIKNNTKVSFAKYNNWFKIFSREKLG